MVNTQTLGVILPIELLTVTSKKLPKLLNQGRFVHSTNLKVICRKDLQNMHGTNILILVTLTCDSTESIVTTLEVFEVGKIPRRQSSASTTHNSDDPWLHSSGIG